MDDIWIYIARESGSIDIATRIINSLSDCFWLIAKNPYLGRSRDHDLSPGWRSFPVGNYVVIYCIEDEFVPILHVVHGSRDVEGLQHQQV